jgi:glycine cleavage system H protein
VELAEYEIPNDLRYSDDDEWVRQDDDSVTVGITDYAQQQLGDIVFIELPEVGSTIDKGEPFGVIESVKAVSDLVAPISGVVVEVNEALMERPEIANEDCYGEGWILAVEGTDGEEYEALLDPSAYRKHVEERSA